MSFYERLREIALSCPWVVRADFLAYTPNELDQTVKKIKFLRLKDRSNDPEITSGMKLT
ncbi:MAG: hypothetical protein HY204_05055 [Nitrospirae bacterium]|nr:hypothetical protein [Nitrospirota bacterium]